VSTSTIEVLLILGKREQFYRLGAPSVYASVVNSHQAFKTEELAKDKVYEFLFVAMPLPLKGGTGSPIHPVAIK
jgi:hypothetical protein